MNEMNKKVLGFEYIRIVACFMVLVTHAITHTTFPVNKAYSFELFIDDFLFMTSRMNVISFVLLSGALLLGKEESYKDWAIKRVLRIILVILLFSSLYYDWANGSFVDYLLTIFQRSITGAFWYLYLYLGIMIVLPVLRKMVIALTENEYRVILLIFILSQSIYPALVQYFNAPPIHSIIASIYGTYISWIAVFILGYYFFRVKDIRRYFSGRKIFVAICIWVLGNLIPTIITYFDAYYWNIPDYYLESQFMIWTLCSTICMNVVLIRLADKTKSDKFKHFVVEISSLTFGIYLLGDLFLKNNLLWELPVSKTSRELLWCFVTFIVGGIITYVLKQIPFIKRLV